jgi:hypothetical protein
MANHRISMQMSFHKFSISSFAKQENNQFSHKEWIIQSDILASQLNA